MKRIIEHPDFTVDVESFDLFDSSESEYPEYILRVVYRRSDDGRRTTSFYDGNKESLDVLYQLLNQGFPEVKRDQGYFPLERKPNYYDNGAKVCCIKNGIAFDGTIVSKPTGIMLQLHNGKFMPFDFDRWYINSR